MQTHLTLKSSNRKVGPIPVSTTSIASCPDSCPLKAGGCYAKGGPLAIHWRKVTEGAAGDDFETFTAKVASLPAGQLWRHNQAGDLPGHGDAIDGRQLGQIVAANAGKRGFTYTHKPMTRAANREAVQAANAVGFTVNLSANTLAEADTLAGLGIAPVVVVLDAPEGERMDTATPEGRKVATCPATYRDDVTCASCQLCQRRDRKVIVGFPAHGASKRKAAAIARS
ncbi:hypothetical protein RQ831_15815 [Roseomonas gilardii]|uniref:DUF7227 domain-containing protein n=1 Tax=Roseomonas gilardii TaxID=257708 RepID=A0ABU3MHQ3_9PROT|nr:hypothetical protein [Roseomonas gilardii]MDT8332528.1 hypothetical protein [Roseomonas gilardii]